MVWKEIDNKLVWEYRFDTFATAFVFLNEVARLAEEQNHHPAIYNEFTKVRLEVTTHDAGHRVTDLDLRFARSIDALRK